MVLIYEIDFKKNEILKYPQKFKLTPLKSEVVSTEKRTLLKKATATNFKILLGIMFIRSFI